MSSHCCVCESRIVDFAEGDLENGPIVLLIGDGMYEFCATCADDATTCRRADGSDVAPRAIFKEAQAKRLQSPTPY